MSKRCDLGQLQRPIGHVHAGRDKLRRVAMPPCLRIEVVSQFDTPAGFEWVVVETTPADDLPIVLAHNGPRSVAVAAAEPFVHGNALAAVAQ